MSSPRTQEMNVLSWWWVMRWRWWWCWGTSWYVDVYSGFFPKEWGILSVNQTGLQEGLRAPSPLNLIVLANICTWETLLATGGLQPHQGTWARCSAQWKPLTYFQSLGTLGNDWRMLLGRWWKALRKTLGRLAPNSVVLFCRGQASGRRLKGPPWRSQGHLGHPNWAVCLAPVRGGWPLHGGNPNWALWHSRKFVSVLCVCVWLSKWWVQTYSCQHRLVREIWLTRCK